MIVVEQDGPYTAAQRAVLKQRQDALVALFKNNNTYITKKRAAVPASNVPIDPGSLLPEAVRERMQDLVGLDDVKRQLASFYNLLELNNLRKVYHKPSSEVQTHMVFTGNPGTGKTTTARLVGKLLKESGILASGHVIETRPNDIMKEHEWGSHVRIMEEKVKKARGGVLFIDEAHSFLDHSGYSEYWRSAVNVLMEEMTAPSTPKSKVSVIFAGYEQEMKRLFSYEPGLKSRFPTYMHFKDYTPQELVKIFNVQAQKAQYYITDDCQDILLKVMKEKSQEGAQNFGNARYVETAFNDTVKAIGNRVATKPFVNEDDISTITPFDINVALKPKPKIV